MQELVRQAEEIKDALYALDEKVDDLNKRQASSLLEVYKSITLILKAQHCLLTDKPSLTLIKD